MKNYGTGIMRCNCSTATRRGKNVQIRANSPKRLACPNCGRMIRVRLITRPEHTTSRPGVAAERKRKRGVRLNALVLSLEAERKDLIKRLKKAETTVRGLEKRLKKGLVEL